MLIYKIVTIADEILILKTLKGCGDAELINYIDFTVKEFKDFRGVKQTVIIRCYIDYCDW